MASGYAPSRCDLCGSAESEVLVQVPTGRSMRSDRKPVRSSLRKLACLGCGLVRSGEIETGIDRTYADDYAVGLMPEHTFYSPAGPRPRSAVLAGWLLEALPEEEWRGARVLEIGAGSGRLLAELARRLPSAAFSGFEPHREATARARAAGLDVHDSWSALGTGFDLACCVAVLEHVASPTAFLRDIADRLRPGATLLLAQPTQDVPSHDVFFTDHLHHFGSAHIAGYSRKCGFAEETVLSGHALLPNFSLHRWRRREGAAAEAWAGPPAATTCAESARGLLESLTRLDALLARFQRDRRRVAVFGLQEIYWLARCYSTLGDFPFVCGLDDEPDRPEYAALGFPVVRPEQCLSRDVEDVVLAMSALYYPAALERLRGLGLVGHPVLGGAA